MKFSGAFFSLKPHLFASLALFILLTAMALEGRRGVRVLLIAPAVILFFAALIFFGLEHDAFARLVAKGKLPGSGQSPADSNPLPDPVSHPATAAPSESPLRGQSSPKLSPSELDYLLRR